MISFSNRYDIFYETDKEYLVRTVDTDGRVL